jgi:hypothetical protein
MIGDPHRLSAWDEHGVRFHPDSRPDDRTGLTAMR